MKSSSNNKINPIKKEAQELWAYYRHEILIDGKRFFWIFAIQALEPFLILPLVLNLISQSELGILGVIESLIVVLMGISQLGVKFAYLQFVSDHPFKNRNEGFWVGTLITALAGLCLGLIASCLIHIPQVLKWIGLKSELPWHLIPLVLFSSNLNMMIITDLRALRNPSPAIWISIIKIILNILFLSYSITPNTNTISSILSFQLLSNMVGIVLLTIANPIPLPKKINFILGKSFLNYGLPIALGNTIKYATDALLPWLGYFIVSAEAAGELIYCQKVSYIFDTFFGLPFMMAWGGRVYHIVKERSIIHMLNSMISQILHLTGVTFIIVLFIGLIIWGNTPKQFYSITEFLIGLGFATFGRSLFMLRSPLSIGFVANRSMNFQIKYSLISLILFLILGSLGFYFGGIWLGWLIYLLIELIVIMSIWHEGFSLLIKNRKRK